MSLKRKVKKKMTRESAKFILGVTGDRCDKHDKRITEIFESYARKDINKETLTKDEFLKFYWKYATYNSAKVYEHLE